MNRTTAASACLAIASLAGLASAQPVFVSGFQHSTLGGATFDPPVERRLPVRNLGSSGEDGVEIQLHTRNGGGVTLDGSPLVFAAAGGEIKIKHKGWDGLIYHRVRTSNQDGVIVDDWDFTGQSAMAVHWRCLGPHGEVMGEGQQDGALVSFSDLGAYLPGVAPRWTYSLNRSVLTSVMVSSKVYDKASPKLLRSSNPGVPPIVIDNVYEIQAWPIICITDPCPGGWGQLQSMMITTRGFSSLDVSDTELDITALSLNGLPPGEPWIGTLSTRAHAIGQAHAEEVDGDDTDGDGAPDRWIRCTNIGSSGQDGVEINLLRLGGGGGGGSAGGPEGVSLRSKRCPDCPPGHVTLIKFTDEAGTEMRMTHSESSDPAGGGGTIDPDFSSLGASAIEVTSYDPNGDPLGSIVVLEPYGYIIAQGGDCPPGSTPIYQQRGNLLFWIGCQYNYDFILPTGGVLQGHSLSFRPLDALASFGPPAGASVTSPTGEVLVGDIRLLGAPPAPCDPDFSGDGNVDQDDVVYLINVISGGENPTGRDPDFNGDGNANQDDVVLLIGVIAGAPCP